MAGTHRENPRSTWRLRAACRVEALADAAAPKPPSRLAPALGARHGWSVPARAQERRRPACDGALHEAR